MTDLFGIIPHLYAQSGKLDKAFIARFCLEGLVKGCQLNDQLSLHIMRNAGSVLGNHVKACIPDMEDALIQESRTNGLKIICVGSVWKSWEYLKDGFLSGLRPVTDEEKALRKVCLVTLKETAKAAVGAAAWASKKSNSNGRSGGVVNLDYTKTANVIFQYEF